MNEDWRNTFRILILPLGAGPGVWPRRVQNPFCTNIVMLHIKSKVIKSRDTVMQKFYLGGMLGSQEVKK